jgi:hypothetical protein
MPPGNSRALIERGKSDHKALALRRHSVDCGGPSDDERCRVSNVSDILDAIPPHIGRHR